MDASFYDLVDLWFGRSPRLEPVQVVGPLFKHNELVVDEWVDVERSTSEVASLVFRREVGRAEAPNAILVAVPEPGQAQGDVGRRSTHVFGRVAVGGVHDVDKQFADDGDCSAGGAIGCARVHVVRGVHDVLT